MFFPSRKGRLLPETRVCFANLKSPTTGKWSETLVAPAAWSPETDGESGFISGVKRTKKVSVGWKSRACGGDIFSENVCYRRIRRGWCLTERLFHYALRTADPKTNSNRFEEAIGAVIRPKLLWPKLSDCWEIKKPFGFVSCCYSIAPKLTDKDSKSNVW